MPQPDAYARFGSQTRGISGSYSCGWGTAPGVCRLTTGPNFGQLGQVDDLTIFFRNTRITLRDALVIDPSSSGGISQAPTVDFSVLDRRWKWQHGGLVYGDFNVPRRNGTLKREASPRQLAAACLTLLGERTFDVSALPTEPRPRVFWPGNDPRSELNRICDDFGCVVCFDPISDSVYISKIGVGSGPLGLRHTARADADIIPAPPDGIAVAGGVVLFQTALSLGDPLGRDVDGSWQKIDDLSYTPAGGWQSVEPFELSQLESEYTDAATGETLFHRELAAATVWRSYRITGQAAGGISPDALVGTAFEPQSYLDLGPFTGTLLDRDFNDERLPVYARGVFYSEDDRLAAGVGPDGNTKPNTRFPGSVSIDNEHRIATFDKPLFKYDEGGKPEKADVVLIAAYACSKDGVPVRFQQNRAAQGQTFGTGYAFEHHEEIVREIIEKSASSTGAARDNLAQVTKQMQYYLDALAPKFQRAKATNATYGGILTNVRLGGQLRSIQWSWSTSDPPKTQCSWNCERSPAVIPWESRKESRQQKIADAAARRARAQAQVAASRASAKLTS